MNFPPPVWGSHFWKVIHYVALSYPERPSYTDKQNFKQFFSSIQYVLPCESCKQNMVSNLRQLPLEQNLENNTKLFKWTVDLHNMVRKETNKPVMSYDSARQLYLNIETEGFSNVSNQRFTKEKILVYSIVALILLFLINKFVFSKKRKR